MVHLRSHWTMRITLLCSGPWILELWNDYERVENDSDAKKEAKN